MRQFTPEATGAVIQGVRAGLTLAEAAERAGLPVQTVANWLSRGRSETGTPHARFAEAVDQAREAAQTEELTEPEFRRLLNRSVRNGSIQAARLWWNVYGTPPDEERPPDFIDALKARRDNRRAAARAMHDRSNGNGQ